MGSREGTGSHSGRIISDTVCGKRSGHWSCRDVGDAGCRAVPGGARRPARRAAGKGPNSRPAQAAEPATNPWRNVSSAPRFEGYYQYRLEPARPTASSRSAPTTRARNTFGIQQAAFVVDAPPDVDAGRRYGLRADLQWGQATETVQGSPANEPRPDVYRNIWQAYGTYLFPVGANGLQTDFGKFASMLGYETNYAKDNQAFSRAYLFNFLPFYHSGLRVTSR